ncbi:MAG: hypothetical protein GQ477_02015 [Nanohaloarchaea archaeon]|nr:hypothetical protein [Candidatus Nanohaloarchaea archaeon]
MSKKIVNRKGITPVIAMVLLLMMTVAAAGLAYEFIMDMTDTQTAAIEDQVSAQSDKMRTDLQILQVQENPITSANLDFIIKNTGTLVVAAIDEGTTNYKVDGAIEITPTFTGTCTSNDALEISETCILTVASEDLPVVGTTKTFEFILNNGYVLAYGCNVVSGTDTHC